MATEEAHNATGEAGQLRVVRGHITHELLEALRARQFEFSRAKNAARSVVLS